MPPERRAPDDPSEWLSRAKSNLQRAQADARLPGVYLEDLCFDAQQAAEKAIKAVLLRGRIPFPYVHDLTALLTLLQEAGEAVPEHIREAARLTRFAVVARYPGAAEPVSQKEYQHAVAIAEAVVSWAERLLEGTGG